MNRQRDWQGYSRFGRFEAGTHLANRPVVARSKGTRGWFAWLTAAVLVGCLSPTLPMPPPAKPDIEGPDERGVVVLSGHAPPESHVFAENENTGFSYGQRTNAVTGAYRFPILARLGDVISMYYRLNEDESTSLVFEIRANPAQAAAGAGAGGASSLPQLEAAGAAGMNASSSHSAGAPGVPVP